MKNEDHNLKDLLNDFLDYRSSLRQSTLTVQVTRSNVGCFIAWMNDSHQVSSTQQLSADHLHSWHRDLGKRMGRWGRPLKPATINKNIESIRVFLGWLAKRELVLPHLVNQLEYVKTPSRLPTSVL